MKKNDVIELKITDITTDGDGVGHLDSMTFFVRDAVVGDTVEAVVMKLKKNYGYARLMRLIEPSPDRINPKCSVARSCGGCQIRYMSYKAQLEFKERLVRGNLTRIGKLDISTFEFDGIESMEDISRYRNKAQYPVGIDKNGEIITGFYAKHSHNIIPCEDCELASKDNALILEAIKEYMRENKVLPYSAGGIIRHILIRNNADCSEIMVCIVTSSGKLPNKEELIKRLCRFQNIVSIVLNINKEDTNVILSDKTVELWGQTFITDKIGDRAYRISANSFFQVNPYMTKKMYDKVLEYLSLTGNETIWDLYCGIGSISLYVAPFAKKVYGVEIIDRAIKDARDNARINGLDNAEFFTGKSEDIVVQYYEEHNGLTADAIIVDPPRKGCDPTLLDMIAKIAPKKLVYVSCDSATLARDIAILKEQGFELIKAKCFDNFPGSVHVETVCLLSNTRQATTTPDVET